MKDFMKKEREKLSMAEHRGEMTVEQVAARPTAHAALAGGGACGGQLRGASVGAPRPATVRDE